MFLPQRSISASSAMGARNIRKGRVHDADDFIVVQPKLGDTDLYRHDVASYVV